MALFLPCGERDSPVISALVTVAPSPGRVVKARTGRHAEKQQWKEEQNAS